MSVQTIPASTAPSTAPSEAMLPNIFVFLLRISLGWVFLWAAIRQIGNPEWSAAQFLSGAKTFPEFYAFFMQPQILPLTNFLVKWGHLLIGVSLIAGVCVRLSSGFGALLMMLYYFPRLEFPYVGSVTYFIVEYHLVYAMILVYLGAIHAGRIGGREPFASRPGLRAWLG